MPGKLYGGVGAQPGTTVAFKGKGKSKGKGGNGDWRGKGWNGKGKGNGKQRFNLASESECNAAWHGGGEEDNGEYDNYYNYDFAYNYALTNNHNDQQLAMHYSMVLTKSKTAITIGAKYFTADMYDGDEDEIEAEEENHNKESGEEPNSARNCTVIGRQAKSNNAKVIWGSRQ